MKTDILYKDESYRIIGICMEVHNNPGADFLEIVFKDALEYEFNIAGTEYQREKEYIVQYKDIILPRKFFADFVVFNSIILEVKSISGIVEIFLIFKLKKIFSILSFYYF